MTDDRRSDNAFSESSNDSASLELSVDRDPSRPHSLDTADGRGARGSNEATHAWDCSLPPTHDPPCRDVAGVRVTSEAKDRCLQPDANDSACTCCQHRWFREDRAPITHVAIRVDGVVGSRTQCRQKTGMGMSVHGAGRAQALNGLGDIQISGQRAVDQRIELGITEGMPPAMKVGGLGRIRRNRVLPLRRQWGCQLGQRRGAAGQRAHREADQAVAKPLAGRRSAQASQGHDIRSFMAIIWRRSATFWFLKAWRGCASGGTMTLSARTGEVGSAIAYLHKRTDT